MTERIKNGDKIEIIGFAKNPDQRSLTLLTLSAKLTQFRFSWRFRNLTDTGGELRDEPLNGGDSVSRFRYDLSMRYSTLLSVISFLR